mmetsp:Transcript_4721/g.15684  ORF Transcript_4721/g.15684 Transcript_4721/m.15684 type:complete len:250 (-) Transcript_4721:301-1050(-)
MSAPIMSMVRAGMSTAVVAAPLARSLRAFRYWMATMYSVAFTPCTAVSSRSRRTAPPSALATMSLASASPLARLTTLVRMPSAWRTSFAASPWLRTMDDSRSPSARSTMDRRSRSAMICASIVVLMSWGGMMCFTSTRVMVTPQRSASRTMVDSSWSLICSRELKVSSRERLAIMLRSVLCVRSSIASGRFWMLNTARRGSEIWKYTRASTLICTVSEVMQACRPKSITCSRMSMRLVTTLRTYVSEEP